MALIDVKNVTARYGGEDVIKNLSFEVDEGDYLLIVGENGTGKTTLLKLLTGLQKCALGSIDFNGVTPKNIGYLPQQNPNQSNFPAKGYEIVFSGFSGKNRSPFLSRQNKVRAIELMNHIGLKSVINKPFLSLSGGQQQRVLLARALVAGEGVLLLDEPVAALDPEATQDMYKTIEHYNKAHDTTVIMVTHDINGAIKYANKVLSIGEHHFFGTAEEYLAMQNGGDGK